MKTSIQLLFLAIWAALAAGTVHAQSTYEPYSFKTLAGAAPGANGPGSAARFAAPGKTTADGAGNIYVADTYNHTIRKITPAGLVSTVAGLAGIYGSADGTGSAARFQYPEAVAVDAGGYLYVADQGNGTIRKITPAGAVSTLAGLAGAYGSADGTGSAARFSSPAGVTVDNSGNIYVTDTYNDTIRKITSAGVVTTLAGLAGSRGTTDGTGSSARFWGPDGITIDSAGNLYVADRGANTIRKVTPARMVITVAGNPTVLDGDGFPQPGYADGTGSAARAIGFLLGALCLGMLTSLH